MKKSLLLLFAALATAAASAQTKCWNGNLRYELDEQSRQAEVTKENYSGYTTLTIPATITCEGVEYRVTGIGNEAFYECAELTDVTLPEGLERIGDKAFVACTKLWYINFPTTLKSIGEEAFYYCRNFGSNGKLNMALPEGLESIGSRAFKMSEVVDVVIPESVTSIGDGVFMASCLCSIVLPQSMTSISKEMFAQTYLETIDIPESVTTIGAGAFNGCSYLEAIDLPEGLESIGDNAFYNCRKLTTVTIPEGVTTIGAGAFNSCTDVSRIYLLGCVESIGADAFYGKTLDIYCYSEEPPYVDASAFRCDRNKSVVHVPESAMEAYCDPENQWGRLFRNIVALTEEEMGVGQLTMDKGQGTMYDLAGRRVTHTEGLKGIYIVDGKKVVVQ